MAAIEPLDAFIESIVNRVIDGVAARLKAPAQPEPPADEWLTPKEAAALLKCSWQRLETLRRVGGGPPFQKEGRLVRYRRAAVEAYKATKPQRRNTIRQADE